MASSPADSNTRGSSKLKKLRMPGSDAGDSAPDLSDYEDPDQSSDAPGSPMADHGAEDDDSVGPDAEDTGSDLGSISDDQLLAEIKKRGLMADLDHGEPDGDESDSAGGSSLEDMISAHSRPRSRSY